MLPIRLAKVCARAQRPLAPEPGPRAAIFTAIVRVVMAALEVNAINIAKIATCPRSAHPPQPVKNSRRRARSPPRPLASVRVRRRFELSTEKFPQEEIERLKGLARLEETLPAADACAACAEARKRSGDATDLCSDHLRQIYGV